VKNKSAMWFFWFYLMITIITSAPFFMKHSPSYSSMLIGIYAFFLCSLVFIIWRFDLQKVGILNHHLLWILAVLVLTGLNIVLYPISRQTAPGTAPNALMEPAIAFFHGGANPYSVRLFDGAPISPGPGWILLNSPFALSGLITLLTPLYLIFSAVMIAKWSKTYALVFIILLAASLCFLQMSIVGHDLPATSLALVGLAFALYRYNEDKPFLILIAILTGILATARVPFIIIPIALSICLNTINHRRAIQFAMISIGLALTIHLVFYFWTSHEHLFYQPLHVFLRASQGSQPLLLSIGTITWIIAGWYMWRHLTQDPASWAFFLYVSISIPFIFVGFGELFSNGFFSAGVWAAWEGKGYVIFTLPLLIAGLLLNLIERSKAEIQE
jgi:hypothetical protein